MRSLLNTQELVRLLKIFNHEQLQVIPYKGAYLAQNYFKDLGLRESSDIDLFIDLKDFQNIKNVLIAEGYTTEGFSSASHEKAFLELNCEFSFKLEDSSKNRFFHIEPHYQSNILADGMYPLSMDDFKPNLKKAELVGVPITVLCPTDNLLLILTHHAVKEGWSKLKYIMRIRG